MGYSKEWYQKNKERLKILHKQWEARNPEKVKEKSRKYRQKVKREVLTYYSYGELTCVKCGFSNIKALTIDHIEGGGNQQRIAINTHLMYIWLRKNHYPVGYQTLCMNCQFIKRETRKEYGG